MTTQAAPAPNAPTRSENRSLAQQGLRPSGCVHWNLVAPELIQQAVRRDEGLLADMGPFVAVTSPHTGRSPNDKFVVEDPDVAHDVWWGKVNQPISPEHFDVLLADVRKYLDASSDLFVQDLWAGADPVHRLSVRFVSPNAWHMQFVRNMFLRPTVGDLASFAPNFTVLHAPEMQADPKRHGTRSSTFIVLSFAKRTILIGGTRYAGELKKS
ncbi:MAG TPA: phosphoenolpyruvate carboxykinase (ATP), partial [Gemmatimonadaceae bacterium]|nr:phosphoenolpyruvate carboxykinase (ATP) [Gemmatimonadaceae bacterium]